MTPRCRCGLPVAYNVRRLIAGFAGPWEAVCASCAPAPTDCAEWRDFYAVGRDAETRSAS